MIRFCEHCFWALSIGRPFRRSVSNAHSEAPYGVQTLWTACGAVLMELNASASNQTHRTATRCISDRLIELFLLLCIRTMARRFTECKANLFGPDVEPGQRQPIKSILAIHGAFRHMTRCLVRNSRTLCSLRSASATRLNPVAYCAQTAIANNFRVIFRILFIS